MEKKINLWVIPTDKPSRLIHNDANQLCYQSNKSFKNDRKFMYRKKFNIYIISDEEIKEGDYFLYDETEIRYKTNGTEYHGRDLCHISGNRRYPVNKSKKIILTTDQSLDGVQDINNEFLEWFVKNPNCGEIQVEKSFHWDNGVYEYEIIIPREEPKQETLEKVSEKIFPKHKGLTTVASNKIMLRRAAWIEGVKWQQKRMYSKEDMRKAFIAGGNSQIEEDDAYGSEYIKYMEKWFEQFKKK